MITVNQLNTTPWTPEFYPAEEILHRLIANEIELSNSIEMAIWNSDPVMPQVCLECRSPVCCLSGLAHVVRTDDQIIWTKPYRLVDERYFTEAIDYYHLIGEELIIPLEMWDEVASEHAELPFSAEISRISTIDLYHLWVANLPSFLIAEFRQRTRAGLPTTLARLEENCVANDPIELDSALQSVREMLSSPPETADPMQGSIRRLEELDLPINTFYFDLEGYPEWRSFALDEHRSFIFDNKWVLFP